jgi:hypothetical protein
MRASCVLDQNENPPAANRRVEDVVELGGPNSLSDTAQSASGQAVRLGVGRPRYTQRGAFYDVHLGVELLVRARNAIRGTHKFTRVARVGGPRGGGLLRQRPERACWRVCFFDETGDPYISLYGKWDRC